MEIIQTDGEPSPTSSDEPNLNIMPFDSDELNEFIEESEDIDNAHIRHMHTNIEPQYKIYMFIDPFEDMINIEIGTGGNNEPIGLIITKIMTS